ncbi:MAG: cysteine desulfurase family protein [Eubacteriales bacterium]|nr:cysteine desulfurase family protein [Eubacteriales bacterium]
MQNVQKEVYFDNAATTRVFPEAAELVMKMMETDYGNPSSRHIRGMEAENAVKEAGERVAKTLRVKPSEIIFTSGGTEADNMALIGTALKRQKRGRHIISSNIEHAAIYKPLEFLEKQGFEVSFLPVDENGHVSAEQLANAIRPDTILVSIMYVNNEIGAVEPIEELARITKEKNASCYFHTDAIQAYGKYDIRPKKEQIDMLSVSGHKLHGPKGTGFLYLDERVNISPILLGGGQQRDFRSGTENVPGIAGLGLAAELYYKNHAAHVEKMTAIKDRLIDRLSAMEGVRVNSGKGLLSAPQIVSASFSGVRAEVLLHALEEKGIYVSSGSACSSNHPAISGTLRAIGLPKELLDSTLRFSFGLFNEPEDADICADAIAELLPVLRRFTRR